MAYATEANVLDWAGGPKRLAASVHETDATLSEKIGKALLSADAKINGLLARAGFTTPVDTSGSTELAALLEECATVFAVVSLLRMAASEAVMKQAAECKKMLQSIQAGDFGLPGTAAPSRRAYGPASTTDDDRPELSAVQMRRDSLVMGL
jgi:phage gp36-like protein